MSQRVTCFKEDRRLIEVDHLAYHLYRNGNLKVHNYDHARWDAERAAEISLVEQPSLAPLTVAAALMHDTGAAVGEYKNHAYNSGFLVRMHLPHLGYSPFEVGLIATAVKQHNSWRHTNDVSRMLYDADTLNKAGEHGIKQCLLVGEEFGLSLVEMKNRFLDYFTKLTEKGYYTDKARELDISMGNEIVPGLELTAEFWHQVNRNIDLGKKNQKRILEDARKCIGVR